VQNLHGCVEIRRQTDRVENSTPRISGRSTLARTLLPLVQPLTE
jgi:hypothetical protein